MHRFTAYISLTFLSVLYCAAQSPGFYVGFDHILDNREYYSQYTRPQTIFGARINAGASFTFDSVHTVCTGINYMYEFGGKLTGVKPQIDLYYNFKNEHLEMRFGSFPRRDLKEYPLLMLTDSLNYYRPNIEGTSIGYSWEWGTIHGWIDWTGRISEKIRESILVGLDATFRAGIFYFEPATIRYHMAHTQAINDENHVRDDGAISLIAGIDLSDLVPVDLLCLSSGSMITYERTKPQDYIWSNGWLSIMHIKHTIVGFKSTYYKGDPSPLLYGDRLYRSGHYGRMDLYFEPFRNQRISSKLGWSFHFLIGERFFNSQQVLIHIMI